MIINKKAPGFPEAFTNVSSYLIPSSKQAEQH